jgi:hypothetical protein
VGNQVAGASIAAALHASLQTRRAHLQPDLG